MIRKVTNSRKNAKAGSPELGTLVSRDSLRTQLLSVVIPVFSEAEVLDIIFRHNLAHRKGIFSP